jgi:hypothetical protein
MMFPGNPFHCEKTMPVHRRGNHDSGMIAGKKKIVFGSCCIWRIKLPSPSYSVVVFPVTFIALTAISFSGLWNFSSIYRMQEGQKCPASLICNVNYPCNFCSLLNFRFDGKFMYICNYTDNPQKF